MSHLYTSLAYALKNNTEILKKSSSGFRELCDQILSKNFSGKQSDHHHHINFAIKKAAKMFSKHGHLCQSPIVQACTDRKIDFVVILDYY
jgi:hypothetical protein